MAGLKPFKPKHPSQTTTSQESPPFPSPTSIDHSSNLTDIEDRLIDFEEPQELEEEQKVNSSCEGNNLSFSTAVSSSLLDVTGQQDSDSETVIGSEQESSSTDIEEQLTDLDMTDTTPLVNSGPNPANPLSDPNVMANLVDAFSTVNTRAQADILQRTMMWPQLKDAVDKISKYNKDNSFVEFLKIFESLLKREEVPEAYKLKALMIAMDEEATEHIHRHPENETELCGTFDEVKEYLKTVFPEKDFDEKKRIFKLSTQKSGEQIQDYVNRKIREGHKIGLDANTKFYKTVVAGLRNHHLREKMLKQVERPYFQKDELMKWITIYSKENRDKSPYRPPTPFRPGSPFRSSDRDSAEHSKNQGSSSNRSSSRERGRSPSKTSLYPEKGNLKKDDRRSRSQSEGRDDSTSRGQRTSKEMICYECGKEGHARANCPPGSST